VRTAGFLGLWLAIAGASGRDLPTGLAAAAVAAWASLRLLPPNLGRPRPFAIARLAVSFLWQSVVAGLDVAWRAFDPRLPLRPGFVSFPISIAPGTARSTFCMLESLLPGTLPAGSDASGALVVHCLDVDRPVLEQMAADEALFAKALGREDGHD
jgi:multicomponent Na+:H+ antiporter subunit E